MSTMSRLRATLEKPSHPLDTAFPQQRSFSSRPLSQSSSTERFRCSFVPSGAGALLASVVVALVSDEMMKVTMTMCPSPLPAPLQTQLPSSSDATVCYLILLSSFFILCHLTCTSHFTLTVFYLCFALDPVVFLYCVSRPVRLTVTILLCCLLLYVCVCQAQSLNFPQDQ